MAKFSRNFALVLRLPVFVRFAEAYDSKGTCPCATRFRALQHFC
jgi:hypothetical protein